MKILIVASVLLSAVASAKNPLFEKGAKNMIIRYSDFYRDDDLVGRCLIYSDLSAAILTDDRLPTQYKPFSLSANEKKQLKALLVTKDGVKDKVDYKNNLVTYPDGRDLEQNPTAVPDMIIFQRAQNGDHEYRAVASDSKLWKLVQNICNMEQQ